MHICTYLYCIALDTQPVGVQCSLTSSLGEFPGYWDWFRYPGLPFVLMSIAFSSFTFHISEFFNPLFTCHWIALVFLLYDRRTCICTHSIDHSLADGEFPDLGLALVPDVPRGGAWNAHEILFQISALAGV